MEWLTSVRRYQRAAWGALLTLALVGFFGFPLMAPAAAETPAITVSIFNFSFGSGDISTPSSITVPVGTTVTWTNQDDSLHTAKSSDGLWDSQTLLPGESFSYTFTTAGTYPYFCLFHPYMQGTVVVTSGE